MYLARLAKSQFGVVSRGQALDEMTPEAVRWKLVRGLWQQVHPGVYAVHDQPLDWYARASAALLHCGDGAALSLESAAFILGLESRQPPVLQVDTPLDTQRVRRPLLRVRRRRRLPTVRRRGLRVTEPAFTVVDLGDVRDATREDAIAVAARAVQKRKATVEQLAAELSRRRTHRHRQALHLSLGVVAAGAESVLEVDFVMRVIRPHGLAEMRMAVPDRAAGLSIRRDFVDDAHRVVVEVDGRVGHEGRRSADMRRDRSTAARGTVTLRAEWVDVYHAACQLAADVFATQRSRGYAGALVACGPRCQAAAHLRRAS